jgi:hypothetical protein
MPNGGTNHISGWLQWNLQKLHQRQKQNNKSLKIIRAILRGGFFLTQGSRLTTHGKDKTILTPCVVRPAPCVLLNIIRTFVPCLKLWAGLSE